MKKFEYWAKYNTLQNVVQWFKRKLNEVKKGFKTFDFKEKREKIWNQKIKKEIFFLAKNSII